jgi:hypothetical protein
MTRLFKLVKVRIIQALLLGMAIALLHLMMTIVILPMDKIEKPYCPCLGIKMSPLGFGELGLELQ